MRTSDGAPVQALVVIITNLDTGEKQSARTDVEGNLAVELPGGDYGLEPEGPLTAEKDLALHIVVKADADQQLELELVKDLARGFSRLAVRQPAETAAASAASDTGVSSELVLIRDYDAILTQLSSASAPVRAPLEELINPFQAARRGSFHGSLYEFHRNDNFDARNFFDPLGEPLPEYKRNQFGVSFAATLIPQLQLMGSYDGLRIIQGSTLLSHVPTREMKQGDFSDLLEMENPIRLRDPLTGDAWPDNRIPVARIHPVSARLLRLLPDPNRSDPDRNFVNNQPLLHNQDTLTLKLDYQLDGAKISSDYNLRNSQTARPHPLPSFASDEEARGQDMRLGLTQNFTRRLLLDLRFSFVRSLTQRYSVNAGHVGLLRSVGIAGVSVADPIDEGYPEFDLSGYTSFGDQSSPVSSVFNGFFTDVTLTYALDTHTVRLGTEFDFREYNNYRFGGSHRGRFSFNGLFTGDSFADFLFGLPETASRAAGADRSDLRGSNWQFFARDTWKVSPLLTLSSGLTYNYFPPFSAVDNNVSGFFPLVMEPPLSGQLVVAGSGAAKQLGLPNSDRSMVFSDKNNFAPRVGVAYSPLGSSRLVIRSSYGIGFEAMAPGYFISYLGHNFPFYYVESVQSSNSFATLDLANPFSAASPVELNVRGIDPRLRNPYYQDWSAGVEAEVRSHWRLQASYHGDKGTRVIRVLPANVPLPSPGDLQARRPNPAFGRFTLVTNSGSYSNNALVLDAERRFSGGLSIDSTFSWNRTISDMFSGNPNNVRNLRAERAPVGYQPNRRLSLRYILDLPFGPGRLVAGNLASIWMQRFVSGWRLTGITHLQDGTPFTVYTAGDVNNDGLSGERPDRIGSGRLPAEQKSIDQWFVTEDFAEPAPYSFGNSGRSILMGPAYQNWDVSIIKQTRFADGKQVELRVELFNAFNQVNFDQPEAVLGNSTFGKIFGAGRAREIEVALKYTF
ncbi:MAG: TonB-dependent receptor [Acidobacteria bacterium]|nr:MAG: TonB-dependent receptor [Acidobacteriota bacterium]